MKNKIIITALLFCSFFVNKSWGQAEIAGHGSTFDLGPGQTGNYILVLDGDGCALVNSIWSITGNGYLSSSFTTGASVTVFQDACTDDEIELSVTYTYSCTDSNNKTTTETDEASETITVSNVQTSGFILKSITPQSNPVTSTFIVDYVIANEQCAAVDAYQIVSSSGTVLASVEANSLNEYKINITLESCSNYKIGVNAYENGILLRGTTNAYTYSTPSIFNTLTYAQPVSATFSDIVNANEIDLNSGFSYYPSGLNQIAILGMAYSPTCSAITSRSSGSIVNDSAVLINKENKSIQSQPIVPTKSVVNLSQTKKITVYPNPTNDKINISILNFAGNADIIIYDFSGNQVYSTTSTTLQTSIDLSSYTSGIYFIKVTSGKMSETTKLVKN